MSSESLDRLDASMAASQFRDYTTGGAFDLKLSRNQVSSLSLVGMGEVNMMGSHSSSLVRKGLVVSMPSEASVTDTHPGIDFKLSYAGMLALNMVRHAGLTNGDSDVVQEQIAVLQNDLRQTRAALLEAVDIANSERVRRKSISLELENAGRAIAGLEDGEARKVKVRIIPEDPLPNLSDDKLVERLDEAILRGRASEAIGGKPAPTPSKTTEDRE